MSCNVDEATYYRWMTKAEKDAEAKRSNIYTEFRKSAQCARAKARTHHVNIIMKNAEQGKDARASLEYLSRTDPDNWAKKDQLAIGGAKNLPPLKLVFEEVEAENGDKGNQEVRQVSKDDAKA
jgi:hypothetical protein